MRRRLSHHPKRSCPRCLSPLSLGLFLTACLLFGFSFVFYFLSVLPVF